MWLSPEINRSGMDTLLLDSDPDSLRLTGGPRQGNAPPTGGLPPGRVSGKSPGNVQLELSWPGSVTAGAGAMPGLGRRVAKCLFGCALALAALAVPWAEPGRAAPRTAVVIVLDGA